MAVMKSGITIKDGFTPGFQRNIRRYCSTYAEYKAHLKRMGLIEFGYEELPEDDGKPKHSMFTDEMLRKIYNSCSADDKFSDREAEHLKTMHKEKDYLK